VKDKLTTAQIVILACGAVAFIASFLPWVSIDLGRFGDTSFNAWDGDVMYWPTFWWVGIFGLVMALQVGLSAFTSVNLPNRVLGFTWPQIHMVLALFAALLTVSFLIGGDEHGIGFYLSLLASIGLVVGAFMLQKESSSRTSFS
jgi:DMSO/TMAO reductase YedYZ heme-binding membrane subunit